MDGSKLDDMRVGYALAALVLCLLEAECRWLSRNESLVRIEGVEDQGHCEPNQVRLDCSLLHWSLQSDGQ